MSDHSYIRARIITVFRSPCKGSNGTVHLRRSLMALVLLLATIVSVVEPVVGQLVDDEIHHRSEVVAAAGADHSQPPDDGPRRSPGSEHKHGTTADHCTHQHSAALVSAVSFVLPVPAYEPALLEPPLHFGRFSGRLFHPPRA